MASKAYPAVQQAESHSSETHSAEKAALFHQNTQSTGRKKLWIILGSVVAAVVVLAVALGVGLGIGLKEISGTAYPSETYTLTQKYQGTDFFDYFDFWSAADPTDGFVIYQLRANAAYENYTYASSSSTTIRTATTVTDTGVNSVRIQSPLNFTRGLFVADITHMPAGCGIWPAFWTSDTSNWPYNGEIDILEGVNLATHNEVTLHTSETCKMSGVQRNETGTVLTSDCGADCGYTGCSVNDTANSDVSFGSGFNTNGGGVYAMDWRSNGIRVWFFPRGSLPTDLQTLSDDPTSTAAPTMSGWGEPVANFPSTKKCDVDSHFENHKVIFDTTLCGTWAGAAATWNASSCYDASTEAATCEGYIKANPSVLEDAYWTIKSVNVYAFDGDDQDVVGSALATTSSSSAAVATSTSAGTSAATTGASRWL